MTENNTRLIVVLGMHRSGTSVIARGLQVMGVDLGNSLMPPFEGNNSKGFWEDLDINTLNNEMLLSLNSAWHFLRPIQSADVELLRSKGYLQSAIGLLREKTAGTSVFGFKDPRVAKLLPFWKEVFFQGQWKVSYVLVIRHPLSVCDSLAKRDNFEFEQSGLLWLEHVIGSLVGTADQNRVLIDYDRLMQMPETEITKIAKVLGLAIDETELEKFRLEFLDQNLRHTAYQLDDLMQNEAISPLAREIYKEILNVSVDNSQLEAATFKRRLAQWNEEFSRQRPALVLADKLTLKINQIISDQLQLIQTLTAQVADQNQALQAHSIQIQELNQIKNSRIWRLSQGFKEVKSWIASQRKKSM